MAKLVDILARDLKEWPGDVKEIEQSCVDGELYYDDRHSTNICHIIASDSGIRQNGGAVVTRSQWQAAVKKLEAETAIKPWSGEGLPPVGTVCEYNNLEPHPVSAELKWSQVHIVAHDTQGGDIFAVFSSLSGYHGDRRPECFRPIRTPEQIAIEVRSKACDAMYGIMTSPPVRDNNRSDMAEALYDAGYRLFEITDDSDPA